MPKDAVEEPAASSKPLGSIPKVSNAHAPACNAWVCATPIVTHVLGNVASLKPPFSEKSSKQGAQETKTH